MSSDCGASPTYARTLENSVCTKSGRGAAKVLSQAGFDAVFGKEFVVHPIRETGGLRHAIGVHQDSVALLKLYPLRLVFNSIQDS